MEIARRSEDIDATYFLSRQSVGETAWKTGRRDEAIVALERAHALAPWFTMTNGWLAAAYRLTGRDDRHEALLATMGPTAQSFWGRVIHHLLLSELDEAADGYERMIDERDPFALVFACEDYAPRAIDHTGRKRVGSSRASERRTRSALPSGSEASRLIQRVRGIDRAVPSVDVCAEWLWKRVPGA